MERFIEFQPTLDGSSDEVAASISEETTLVQNSSEAGSLVDADTLAKTKDRLEVWRRGGALASDSAFRVQNHHGNQSL